MRSKDQFIFCFLASRYSLAHQKLLYCPYISINNSSNYVPQVQVWSAPRHLVAKAQSGCLVENKKARWCRDRPDLEKTRNTCSNLMRKILRVEQHKNFTYKIDSKVNG